MKLSLHPRAARAIVALSLAIAGCDSSAPTAPAPSATASTAAVAPSTSIAKAPAAPTATASASPLQDPLIDWVAAPDGDLAEIVKREAERAKKDGRTLLVYVGATWCEPCLRFHQAAENGEITGDLPRLRMLEFDLDRDGERLAAAGYASKMIPLFAAPGPDGRGNDLHIQGSVKGPGAVSNLVPRLRALVARMKGS